MNAVSVPLPNVYRPVEMDVLEAQVSFLKGKVLTIIDAAIADQEQRKAVKDLVKGAFQSQVEAIRTSHLNAGSLLAMGKFDSEHITLTPPKAEDVQA